MKIITYCFLMNIVLFYNIINFSISLDIVLIDAVYNLLYKNLYLTFLNKKIYLSKSHIGSINTNFRIKKNSYLVNNSYYYIEHVETNYTISLSKKKEIISYSKQNNDNRLNMSLWHFFKTKNNKYYIQNINKCYLIVKNLSINCKIIDAENASQFKLIKIYEEINENILDNKLIEKEPIDVLIKYIDLRDPFLKRDGIHQIKKDYDNEELRFSIRSILKNIPWVRKIFILMPNKKVRYFKNSNLIKKRIVYINDKDLLGFDSSSSITFQFNYWKMKKFGISNNFIVMDDDCFIGHPLKKNDFFYHSNNKILPIIITNRFKEIEKKTAEKQLAFFKKIIKSTKIEQTGDFFRYSQYLTYLFILNIFKKSLIIPKFTHNAIPVNLDEIKEIYDLIFLSKYKSSTLYSTYRHIESLQFQTFILSYTFIKYNKKVKFLSYKYISNKNSLNANYNYHLFCINTNAYHNSNLSFLKTRFVMEYLFPEKTPYEKIDDSLLTISFKLLKLMNKEFDNKKNSDTYKKITLIVNKERLNHQKLIRNFLFNIIYLILLLLYKKILVNKNKISLDNTKNINIKK